MVNYSAAVQLRFVFVPEARCRLGVARHLDGECLNLGTENGRNCLKTLAPRPWLENCFRLVPKGGSSHRWIEAAVLEEVVDMLSRFRLPVALVGAFAALAVAASGCLPYLYKERAPSLIQGIDIDQSLDVAQRELDKTKATSVLGVWALRDQTVTAAQAARINDMYLEGIPRIDNERMHHRSFAVWHFTWAISNLYRFGDDAVKAALEPAHVDAMARAEKLDRRVVDKLVLGKDIYSGPAHSLGRAYARKHLVVPGNDDYLQSFAQYVEAEEE
jgi:hypothetical protein